MALSAVALLLTAQTEAPAAAQPPKYPRETGYVALGDSYTSGPGIPDSADLSCGRSSSNYPSVVSSELRPASFTDASCGGATTAEMWQAQRANPPQLSALSGRTTMVTVQIGGNDAGVVSAGAKCMVLAVTDPAGSPCRRHYTGRDGGDTLARAIRDTGPKVAAVLRAVRERAPRARVVVVGYPDMLPEDGLGCAPAVPFARGDFAYLRDSEKRLDAMLAGQARAAHVEYVDTYAPTVGHDMCTPPDVRWIEPFVPHSPAAAFHPNARGERAMARAVLERLRRAPGAW